MQEIKKRRNLGHVRRPNSTCYRRRCDEANFIANPLGAEGYVVHSHDSALAFLNAIKKDDVGCIVTDVNMPEMTGIELLCEMCKVHMGMPAIVISGLMDARLNQESKEQGAFRCFQSRSI